MPKVPVEAPQFSTSVPYPQLPYTREFGKEGMALQGVGQQVETQGFDIANRLAQASSVDQAQQTLVSQQGDGIQKWHELNKSSPDGFSRDPQGNIVHDATTGKQRTIVDDYRDWANQQYMDAQDKMNFRTQEVYKAQAAPYFSNQARQYELETLQKSDDYFKDSGIMTAKKQGADPGNAPSFVMSSTQSPAMDANGKAIYDSQGNPVMETRPAGDASKFYGNLQQSLTYASQGVGKTLDPFQAKQYQVALGNTMSRESSEVMVSNLLAGKKLGVGNSREQIIAGIDLLRGDDPQSKQRRAQGLPTLSESLDPDLRERQIDRLIKAIPVAKERDLDNLKHLTEDTGVALEMGQPLEGPLHQSFTGILQQWHDVAVENPQKYGVTATQNVVGLLAKQYKGLITKPDFLASSEQNQAAVMGKYSASVLKAGQAWAKNIPNSAAITAPMIHEIRTNFSDMQKKIRAEKKEDSVAFAWKPRPDMLSPQGIPQAVLDTGAQWENFYNQQVGPQKNSFVGLGQGDGPALYKKAADDYGFHVARVWKGDGIKYRSPIDLQTSKDIGGYLTKIDPSVSESQKGAAVASLVRTFGKYYPQNIQQMVEDKSVPAGMGRIMALHATDDPQSQMKLMSVLTGGAVERENFKNMIANGSVTESQAEQVVNQAAAPWVNSYAHVDAYSNARAENEKSMQDAIFTGMVKNLRDKQITNPKLSDIKAAAKNSFDDLVGNFGTPVKYGETDDPLRPTVGAVSQGWLPKYYRGIPVDADLVRANLNYDKTHVETYTPIVPTVGGKPSMQADKFIPMVNQTAFPVVSQNPPGHFLKYTNSNGQTDWLYQKGPDGQPRRVFIPLRDSLVTRPVPLKPNFTPADPEKGLGRNPQSTEDYENYKKSTDMVNSGALVKAISHMTGGGPVTEETANMYAPYSNRDYPNLLRQEFDPNFQGHATDIMANKVLGFRPEKQPADYTQKELNQWDELRNALKTGHELPTWLTPKQKEMLRQFREHTRP